MSTTTRTVISYDAASQTFTATCLCGWRFHASTAQHAEVRGAEHTRDEH